MQPEESPIGPGERDRGTSDSRWPAPDRASPAADARSTPAADVCSTPAVDVCSLPPAREGDPASSETGPSTRPGPHEQGGGSEGGALAAAIYTGISFVAALIFWVVTTFAGSYPAVARYGGAIWVFILFMIVLMPVVIPRVRRRRQRRTESGAPVGA